MVYTAVTFLATDAQRAEIVVALLGNAGFEGFEEKENEVTCFIKQEEFDEMIVKDTATQFNLTYRLEAVKQQNWNAQWESSFEPVVIENLVAVRAAFHQPFPRVKYDIIITPKMSFGTGHHATTYLMLKQMGEMDFTDKSVFDFGTGTGVLAIAAEKMGAAKVVAVDNDEWSINNSLENIQANDCNKINISLAEKIDSGNCYDIILANINLNVLLANMADIAAICNKNAVVLFSGILTGDEEQLKQAAATSGLIFKNMLHKDNWLCIKADYYTKE